MSGHFLSGPHLAKPTGYRVVVEKNWCESYVMWHETCICTYVRIYLPLYLPNKIHTRAQAHTHTQTDTCTLTHAHTHTNAHARAREHIA